MNAQDPEGYEEEFQRMLDAMPPEIRFRGVPPEQIVLAFPDDFLRHLGDKFLALLPDETRAVIRRRLGQG